MKAAVYVCPVCREQLDYHGSEGAQCWHAEYGDVEGVEVEAFVNSGRVAEAIVGAQAELAVRRAQMEAQRATAERWRNFTPEERAAEVAKLPPEVRALRTIVRHFAV